MAGSAAPGAAAGPGAVRTGEGVVVLNGDRTAAERITLVVVNTGDRPVQIGSHLHLPDANTALSFDRAAALGFRLDIPSGTSRRFEPGASREVDAVALRGARRVPGLQLGERPDLGPSPAATGTGTGTSTSTSTDATPTAGEAPRG